MGKSAFRLRFTFWLDMSKPDEENIAETISDLKQRRLFSQTIRDGIRLITSLRAGHLDVLNELFPWVREAMTETILNDGAGGNSSQTAAIQRQLAELERLLLAQDSGRVMAPVAGGPKPLAIPRPAAAPIPDDDLPALVVTKSKAAGNSAQKFLDQCFSTFGVQ